MPAKKKSPPKPRVTERRMAAARKAMQERAASEKKKPKTIEAAKAKRKPPTGWFIPNNMTNEKKAVYPFGLEGIKVYGPSGEARLHRVSTDQPIIVVLDGGQMLRLQIIDDELHIIKGDNKETQSIIVRGDRFNSVYVK